MRHIFALGFILAACAMGQDRVVPLFTIEKSSNENRVQYEAHLLANGHFDTKLPVVAYWVMENGRKQELNYLERTKAYGFTIRPDTVPDSYKLWVVSHREKEIHVYRDGSGVRAEAFIDGRVALVNKIFVQMKAAWLWNFPAFAEMVGSDKETGAERREKVYRTD